MILSTVHELQIILAATHVLKKVLKTHNFLTFLPDELISMFQ